MRDDFQVCVIDDDHDMAKIISDIFSMEGFHCPMFPNPCEAIEPILSAKPKVVIVDIRMPQVNGLTLMGQLRERGCKSDFYFFTGHSPHSKKQLKSMGASGLYRKPDGMPELVRESLESLKFTSSVKV